MFAMDFKGPRPHYWPTTKIPWQPSTRSWAELVYHGEREPVCLGDRGERSWLWAAERKNGLTAPHQETRARPSSWVVLRFPATLGHSFPSSLQEDKSTRLEKKRRTCTTSTKSLTTAVRRFSLHQTSLSVEAPSIASSAQAASSSFSLSRLLYLGSQVYSFL